MTHLRVGQLDYLNALPFFGGFLTGEVSAEVEWQRGNPSQLNALLDRGELDLALISSYHYLSHQEELELLPGHCIAAVDEVQSVLLYKRKGIEKIDGVQVAVTQESKTGVQLLKVLCERFWNVTPKIVPLPSIEEATNYPAFLLIGDQALLRPTIPGYYTVDLATAWHEKTALPMTFALFAARKEVMAKRGDEVMAFMRKLETSYKWGTRNEGIILDLAEKQSGLARAQLKAYYPLLHYRLEKEELAGLKAFATLSDEPCNALV